MENSIKIKRRESLSIKDSCEKCLNAMNEAFTSEKLARYGLKRDAGTFEDMMRDGANSIRDYRNALEKELPVNSELAFLSEGAKKRVDEAVGELKRYISNLRQKGIPSKTGLNIRMSLTSERVKFDEACGRIVLTDEGKDILDHLTNVYLTTKKQVVAYNLAIEIKEKINTLDSILKGSRLVTLRENSRFGIINYSINGAELNAEQVELLAKL